MANKKLDLEISYVLYLLHAYYKIQELPFQLAYNQIQRLNIHSDANEDYVILIHLRNEFIYKAKTCNTL